MRTMAIALLLTALGLASMLNVQDSTPMAEADEPDRIELPGDAGEALFWQGGPRTVLLAHGAAYDAASWTDQAEAINDAGYAVLSLESIDPAAINTALEWLLVRHDAAGVVVIGASAGGGAALRALAEQRTGLVGLVLLGTTGETSELGDYPKLFTASEGERMTDRLETMADESPGESNRVEIIPGNAHAQATFDNPEGGQLLDEILAFLEQDAAWPVAIGTPVASPTDESSQETKDRHSAKSRTWPVPVSIRIQTA